MEHTNNGVHLGHPKLILCLTSPARVGLGKFPKIKNKQMRYTFPDRIRFDFFIYCHEEMRFPPLLLGSLLPDSAGGLVVLFCT